MLRLGETDPVSGDILIGILDGLEKRQYLPRPTADHVRVRRPAPT